jgi:LemA protein
MRNTLIIVAIIGGILLFTGCNSYNSIVNKDQAVKNRWAQVQNVYQRRADLIPNLVETVKGAANFEKSTLEAVVKARAEATRPEINIDPASLTPENFARFQQAQGAVTSSLSRLLAVVENYPDLKSNQNFLALQAELAGTENRISVERREFNNAVQDYNGTVVRFPGSLFAGVFGFRERPYFEAQPGADKAPAVKF